MTDETQAVDQATEQSMEDRVANRFGIEDAPQEIPVEGQDEGEPSEALESADVEIEYDGETFKIPKKLEKAILQERDYTRKQQELADQRRQVEHERKVGQAHVMERQFHESVAGEIKQVEALDGYLKHLEGIDVRALPIDDQIAHLAELSRVPRQREMLVRHVEGKRAEFEKGVQEKINEIRQSAREALSKQIPGLNDELMASLRTHAKSFGFTEQDADGVLSDPRSSLVLYKAMRYDQLQANKDAAVKKATAASPTIKPGASNAMPQQVRDKLSFNKAMKAAPNSQAKARLIEQRLANSF